MPEAVGIMGGTFDPIHFGHLVAAEEARTRFSLTRVVFVPSGVPPHKKAYDVTCAEHRYNMVVLATASNRWFETSRVELDRPGPSYTADTVEQFRSRLGADARLYFITGADAILELPTWHDPQRILEACDLIAVTRPGYDLGRMERALGAKTVGRVHPLHAPGLDISSTELRRRATLGESLRYLTPRPVERYIEAHQLYRKADGVAPRSTRDAAAASRPGAGERR